MLEPLLHLIQYLRRILDYIPASLGLGRDEIEGGGRVHYYGNERGRESGGGEREGEGERIMGETVEKEGRESVCA